MTPLSFTSRPKIKKTDSGTFRSFKSLDGRYRVVEIRSTFAGRYWLAARIMLRGEYPVGRGTTREAVVAACERHRRS